ncbi:MAG TPA: cyclic nucleotide-binding domain-containing protein [Symbiobacteriaceae bacterium]|nr:cyclic nucleotide-binding domain-containing protein [Symbiobacteriaceae bacterium]
MEMSVAEADDYEISHQVYQPGEVIITEGVVGQHLYLITEGEVELLRGGGDLRARLGKIQRGGNAMPSTVTIYTTPT